MKTYFNGHPGFQDENFFVFYGLFFDNILEVSNFFKDIPVRNWKGENYRGYKILKDKCTKEYYFYGELYDTSTDIEELVNFIDAENK